MEDFEKQKERFMQETLTMALAAGLLRSNHEHGGETIAAAPPLPPPPPQEEKAKTRQNARRSQNGVKKNQQEPREIGENKRANEKKIVRGSSLRKKSV